MILLYYIVSAVFIIAQCGVLVEAYRHVIYTLRKYRPKPARYLPRTAMIAPCKGIDTTFDRNIESFFGQAYPNYEIYFVVESTDDPAYARLADIIRRQSEQGSSVKAHLLVAGVSTARGQKVHNLMAAVDAAPAAVEVFAFVDSDACLKDHFLQNLVHPLRRQGVGASTGYRWYVPTDGRLSSKVLSAMNAYVASLMGPHPWNSAWGGAMAIRRDRFEQFGIRQAWKQACSDDYSLSRRVKQSGSSIAFSPACFVASYDQMSWKELFSFARRQFIFTKVYYPSFWRLGILGLGHYVVGFWLGVVVTAVLWQRGSEQVSYAMILPAVLYLSSVLKGAARQLIIRKILPEDRHQLLAPGLIDVFFQPVVAGITLVCLLSAAGTRTVIWRGYRYFLRDADHTEISPVSNGAGKVYS